MSSKIIIIIIIIIIINLLTKFCKSIFYISFKAVVSRTAILIHTNYLYIDFLEFFPYWCYLFDLYSFIFQDQSEWPSSYNLIIKLSKNEKLQKYSIYLCQYTSYLHKWLVHLSFEVFTAAMFIYFFSKIPKYVHVQYNILSP